METSPPAPDSFRKLIHDLNQIIFLMRGNCELAKTTNMDPDNLGEHIQNMEAYLEDLGTLAAELKQKQLELAPNE